MKKHEHHEKRHIRIRDEPDQEFRRASSISDEEYERERRLSSENERFNDEDAGTADRTDGTAIEGDE